MNKTLYRTKFIEWLKSKQPNEVVGYARKLCNCPIACYMNERDGLDGPGVTGWGVVGDAHYLVSDTPPEDIPNPLWAQKFIRAVDESRWHHDAITAQEALAALGVTD